MKILILSFLPTLTPVCIAANETAPAGEDIIGAANELKIEGDWVQLAPYGDWPNRDGLQRFQKPDAQNIVNEFGSLLATPSRLLGLPFYIGHPDHPAFKDRYKDTRAYGRIKKLEAREDGLFANVKWSSAGKDLIESEAFHGHSVNWAMRKEGSAWRPFRLKSVGFTNEPGIPVAPITAANEKNDTMNRTALIALLKLAADATDDQISAAISAKDTALAANESNLTRLNQQVTDLTTEKGTLAGRVTTLETSFANERKAHAAILLDAALQSGRITAAERPQWETDFANEFTGAETKLKGLKPKLHTQSVTAGLGKVSTEARKSSQEIRDAVNERMTKTGESYDAAWLFVKREKPALFGTTSGEKN